ncbi:hypothetical protein J6TS7_29430 [Paenibacillus dendritiformis]|uniref:hypothetical protein n=1 Tax=Paenibacillus TaxID=44249 RepID=UPI001B1AD022|nr:hypothetical protein [Paenibacillus dendritiformis]GIO79333.1 hypothetical protein J6TS7_29430 [Paenibacillus dendritiformis]
MQNSSFPIPEYIGAAAFARMLGTTQQNVSKSGRRALEQHYRGDFLRPHALCEGRPLWLKVKAEEYAKKERR